MSDQAPRPLPLTMRAIHAAIALGLFILFIVISFLTLSGSGAPMAERPQILSYLGWALIFGSAAAAFVIRSKLPAPAPAPAPAPDSDLAGWWQKNSRYAIVIWALLEGGGMGGIVLGYLAGSTALMGSALIVSLILLFIMRPGALERPL